MVEAEGAWGTVPVICQSTLNGLLRLTILYRSRVPPEGKEDIVGILLTTITLEAGILRRLLTLRPVRT